MAATIQTILKPTRARGLDTSGGEQIVGNQLLEDPSFDVDVAEATDGNSTTGSHWKVNDADLEITGGKAVWTSYSGSNNRRLQEKTEPGPFTDITARYRVSITVSDYTSGELKFVTGNYNTGYTINSAKTWVFDMSPEIGSGNLQIDASTDAVMSVSDVTVYKLESFGNNNHAQIYSGRALEFDGVTDYLNVGNAAGQIFVNYRNETTAADRAWTVAVWLNYDAAGSSNQSITGFDNSGDVSTSNYLRLSNTETLGFYDIGGNASRTGDTVLKPKTWYRAVFVYNGSDTVNFYLNGVADGSGTLTSSDANNNADLNISYIGGAFQSSVFASAFAGKMSDFQAWQGAWTADDVMYDYLNPEQLVLNRGGTSLTNSNLKLWYPMNEGHRGNQSYVLDASNTGLGDEIEMDGDFSEFTTISSPRGNSNISGIALTNWIEQGDNDGEYADSTGSGAYTISKIENGIRLETTEAGSASWHHRIYNRIGNSLTEGVTYRLKFDLKADAQKTVRFQNTASTIVLTDAPASPSSTEFTTYTEYFTMTGDSNLGFFIFGNATNVGSFFEIRNVSIVPINDKHSATTVFFGDDLFDSGVGDYGDSTGAWAVEGNNTIANDTSALKITYVDDDDGAKLFLKDAADLTSDLTIGRNYRLTFTYKINQVSGANVSLQINQGDATFATTGTLNQTSFTTLTKDFTAMHATDANVKFNNLSSGDILHVKDFTLKEIGIASGWTDADQQLDIPQTALQSYNQLAYFLGQDNQYAELDSTVGVGYAGNWSISFWLYEEENDDNYSWPLGVDTARNILTENNQTHKLHFRGHDGGSATYYLLADYVIPHGQWNHIVVTATGNTSMQAYINGQQFTANSDMDDTEFRLKRFMQGYGTNHQTKGSITEIAYYTSVLTEANVLDLYNNGKCKSALEASGSAGLTGYWKNNGLAEWKDLKGSNDANCHSEVIHTMLITAGVDSSRDSQGFFMNRQKTTNTLNLPIIDFASNTYTVGSSEIEIPNPSLTYSDTGFSVECWFKAAILGQPMFFICHQEGGNSAEGFHLRWAGGNVVYAVISDGTNEAAAAISGTLNADQWYHIVASWDHSNKKKYVYIDGILRQVETESSMGTIAPNADIHIGTRRGETDQDFIGQIDDVKLYNRILTDGGVTTGQSDSNGLSTAAKGEVLRNYNAGKRSHK